MFKLKNWLNIAFVLFNKLIVWLNLTQLLYTDLAQLLGFWNLLEFFFFLIAAVVWRGFFNSKQTQSRKYL